METKTFLNREVENQQRRKLKIIEQSPDEMIVDVEFAGRVLSEGTPIYAEDINSFQNKIKLANENAENALDAANSAKANANSSLSQAGTAIKNASDAVETSNRAETKALEAKVEVESINVKATTAIEVSTAAKSTAEAANISASDAVETAGLAVTTANSAKEESALALSNSANAVEKVTIAKSVADSALAQAQEVESVANEANSKADNALAQVVAKQGTKVLVNKEYISEFDADLKADKVSVESIASTKADKTQLDNYLPKTGGTISGSLNVMGQTTFNGIINVTGINIITQ